MKFLWFENMKKDLGQVTRELCDFLGYPLTEDKVADLVKFLHIDNYRYSRCFYS